jgi:hypothetical protein
MKSPVHSLLFNTHTLVYFQKSRYRIAHGVGLSKSAIRECVWSASSFPTLVTINETSTAGAMSLPSSSSRVSKRPIYTGYEVGVCALPLTLCCFTECSRCCSCVDQAGASGYTNHLPVFFLPPQGVVLVSLNEKFQSSWCECCWQYSKTNTRTRYEKTSESRSTCFTREMKTQTSWHRAGIMFGMQNYRFHNLE